MATTPKKTGLGRLRLKKRWRAWLRALHRDFGYLAVGLTFVYALSGIAINHLGEWDPNFKSVVETTSLAGPYASDEEELGKQVARHLHIPEDEIQAAFYDTETIFEVSLSNGIARLDTQKGTIKTASKKPRFLLRTINWLHYNRGKSAWTYIADGYAFFLLFLATSGLFMIRGRKGLIGRGGVLLLMGVAIPVLYVHFASGP